MIFNLSEIFRDPWGEFLGFAKYFQMHIDDCNFDSDGDSSGCGKCEQVVLKAFNWYGTWGIFTYPCVWYPNPPTTTPPNPSERRTRVPGVVCHLRVNIHAQPQG